MKTTITYLILCCVFLFAPIPANAQGGDQQTSAETLQKRKELAESGEFLQAFLPLQSSDVSSTATGSALAEAIDLDPSILVNASVAGSSPASAVFTNLGVITPKRGSTFAVLSSGVAGTSQPEPGTDFYPVDTSGDRATLTLNLNVPEGANRLSFDYNFLSSEYPDFIGTIFNDTFIATVTDSNGLREITRASVNSSLFFPASSTLAGGSGFDIFTTYPSGVDTVFGGGLPDAGLTGFKSINVPITGGGPVTLQFYVEDRGDGILDSAVILDNLVISSLEVVDPNPDFISASGDSVLTDPETLAQGGQPRVGAAADGVTRVLLRNKVSGPGIVEFCLVGGTASKDGGFALLGTSGRATCVTTPVVSTSKGYMAFAVYRTPDDFNRVGDIDANLAERPVTFRARFTPNSGSVVESTLPFKLVRPPVVLVHGLWSSAGTWTFLLVTDSRFLVTRADYQSTNASYFSTNLLVPLDYLRDALALVHSQDIAATQVDIIGHSMGGILSRNHVGAGFYKNFSNFKEGDINKLITLNTPHTGSPLANLLVAVRESLNPLNKIVLLEVLAALGHPIGEGAIDNLVKGSSAINAIQHTPVPSHALVGIGGSDELELIPGIGDLYKGINFFADYGDVFQSLQHDGIVGRQSQEGGMSTNAYTVFGGLDSIHTSVTGNNDYSNRVIQLLNSPAQGSLFEEFPAPSTISSLSDLDVMVDVPDLTTQDKQIGTLSTDLTITSPANGTAVTSGNSINVVVTPNVGVTVDQILLTGPGIALIDTTAPFTFDLTIPIDAIGEFQISATGKDGSSNFVVSDPIALHVNAPAALNSITVSPQTLVLSEVGITRTLSLLGSYADGVIRDITSSSTGTEYLVSGSEVVSVSPDGIITVLSGGAAAIVVRNDLVESSINVLVQLPNQSPISDAGQDITTSEGSQVTLNGVNSADPDGSPAPLSFEWLQIGGPEVILTDPTTSTPGTPPLEEGVYTFSLVVRDGQDDSQPDSVTITVVGIAKVYLPIILRSGSSGGGDTYEPNDTPATSYGPLSPGVTYQSYIWTPTDDDGYWINITNLNPIVVNLTNIPIGTDYDLELFDVDVNIVAGSYNFGNTAEYIYFVPPSTGKYYVLVYPYNGYSTTQPYHLRVGFNGITSLQEPSAETPKTESNLQKERRQLSSEWRSD